MNNVIATIKKPARHIFISVNSFNLGQLWRLTRRTAYTETVLRSRKKCPKSARLTSGAVSPNLARLRARVML
jgi:hypothetical protein